MQTAIGLLVALAVGLGQVGKGVTQRFELCPRGAQLRVEAPDLQLGGLTLGLQGGFGRLVLRGRDLRQRRRLHQQRAHLYLALLLVLRLVGVVVALDRRSVLTGGRDLSCVHRDKRGQRGRVHRHVLEAHRVVQILDEPGDLTIAHGDQAGHNLDHVLAQHLVLDKGLESLRRDAQLLQVELEVVLVELLGLRIEELLAEDAIAQRRGIDRQAHLAGLFTDQDVLDHVVHHVQALDTIVQRLRAREADVFQRRALLKRGAVDRQALGLAQLDEVHRRQAVEPRLATQHLLDGRRVGAPLATRGRRQLIAHVQLSEIDGMPGHRRQLSGQRVRVGAATGSTRVKGEDEHDDEDREQEVDECRARFLTQELHREWGH